MKNLIMWNVISLDGYFEGEKAWDLEFHDLAWGEGLENFSIEQLKSAIVIRKKSIKPPMGNPLEVIQALLIGLESVRKMVA